MANEFDDLINKYMTPGQASSGGTTPAPAANSSSPDIQLLDKYMSNREPDVIPAQNGKPARITVRPLPPMNGQPQFTTEEEEQASIARGKSNELRAKELPRGLQAVVDAPGEWLTNTAKNYNDVINVGGEAVSDLQAHRPFSAIGKAGMALLGAVGAPFAGAIDVAKDDISSVTGNPDIGDRAAFVLGSGVPVRSIGSVLNTIRPKNVALQGIVDAIGVNNLPAAIQRLKDNPRLTIADLSPSMMQGAQKLATSESAKVKNKIGAFTKEQERTAKGQVEQIYNNALGAPVDVFNRVKEMQDAAKAVGKKVINPAIENAKPVNVSPVLEHIENTLNPGIMSKISAGQTLPYDTIQKELETTRKFLSTGEAQRIDAESLHNIQSSLRARADDLLNSSTGSDRQLGRALYEVRNKLVDQIDAASPRINVDGKEIGSYKHGLSKFRDEKQIEDAFTKGMLVTKNRLGQLEDRPEFWREWINDPTRTKHELDAAREGARLAVDQQINGFRNGALKGELIPEIEFNKQKLAMLFGKDEIEKMSKLLRDERDIAQRNHNLFQGSQTAMRMKTDEIFSQPTPKESNSNSLLKAIGVLGGETANLYYGGPIPGGIIGTYLAGKALNFGTNRLSRAHTFQRDYNMANMITAEGEARDQLIKALESYVQPSGLTGKSKLKMMKNSVLRLPATPPNP